VKRLVAAVHAAFFTCAIAPAASAQDTVPLAARSEFGYQTLVDGAPSRSGFPPFFDCPVVRKHAYAQPWNDWTRENLPDGCRDAQPAPDPVTTHSRFEVRTYIDVATIGWDDTYGSLIPSLVGFHVSFANLGTWTLGVGGVLASFSPVFDLQTGARRYQMSPRLNVLNLNKQLKPLGRWDLFFSVAATRELFLPATATLDGSRRFNNVFVGVSLSPRRP